MTKTSALELLAEKNEAITALNMAASLIHWDAATTGVPEKSLQKRGNAAGWLEGESFARFIAPDTLEAIEVLEGCLDELNEYEKAMVRELGRLYRKAQAIPPEEMKAYASLLSQAESVWEKARDKDDYALVQPYYEKIFAFNRRMCDWYGFEGHPYNALLDDYDKGTTIDIADEFFSLLREKITPLVKMVSESDKKPPEIKGVFPIEKQRELTKWLCEITGYDVTRGKIGEVEHPFCMTITRNDVRITTKYHEDSLLSSVYSVIHEAGHAIYEQNMPEILEDYALAGAASNAMHESQSRLYENMIGRSRAFAEILLVKLKELFDDFKDWDSEMLYRAVNVARPSLIRIEADELTYCLHIIVRYELEKAIIKGEIKVEDLPGLWADKYEELLGIRPSNYATGVLQDVHWSAGLAGYFPSYALGTAYAAHYLHAMNKAFDVDAAVRAGDFTPINDWLKENVHQHGEIFMPDELIRRATGEDFNPQYYVDYLEKKFTELYK